MHTRTVLTLPPSVNLSTNSLQTNPPPEEADEYQARRAREKAVKRLQTLTKETDWRVAKTYVALADIMSNEDDNDKEIEAKKRGQTIDKPLQDGLSLEEAAVDSYLDDEEWERKERQEGRGVQIPRFPLLDGHASAADKQPALSRLWSAWRSS